MEFRPDIKTADRRGNTPLHYVRAGTPHEHVQLLVRAGALLDAQNNDGLTALSVALLYENDTAASYLIERRPNINVVSQVYGAPLHLACQVSDLDMVRRLVAAGADVDLVAAGDTSTPLHKALFHRRHLSSEDLTSLPASSSRKQGSKGGREQAERCVQ